MQTIKKIFYACVILVVLLVSVPFYLNNNQQIELNYIGFHWTGQLAILILVTFILGAIAGYMINLIATIKLRRQLSSATKDLKERQDSPLEIS